MKLPMGRFGSPSTGRARRRALATTSRASSWPTIRTYFRRKNGQKCDLLTSPRGGDKLGLQVLDLAELVGRGGCTVKEFGGFRFGLA